MKHILVLTALIGAIFIFTTNVEATRCHEKCQPQPTRSPNVTAMPTVSPVPSSTPQASASAVPSPTNTTEPERTTEPARTDLSDNRSDGKGCSVNDCSGNKVEPQVTGQSAQVLPATGSNELLQSIGIFIVGVVVGSLLKMYADGNNI